MPAKLQFFLAGVATTVAIIAAGFGGGALFASSASKQVRPARVDHQTAVPVVRVALPATSEPTTVEPAVAIGLPKEKAQQSQLLPQAPQTQPAVRPRTRRELREERRKLRAERRAERREGRHHRDAGQQQEAGRNGETAPQ